MSDGHSWVTVATERRHDVDAAVLHTQLFPAWNVAEEQVGYHHSLDQALHSTARQPGVVIAVRPPGLEQVMASAARGERMPRKSTHTCVYWCPKCGPKLRYSWPSKWPQPRS